MNTLYRLESLMFTVNRFLALSEGFKQPLSDLIGID